MRFLFLFFAFISIAGAAGYLQNEDFKTEAELLGAGGSVSQLLNDTKIYVTGNGINKTLDDAIVDGDIGGGVELTTKGNLIGFGSATEECVLDKTDDKILTVDSTATCGFDFKDAPVSTTLTTKGDIQTFDTANQRLAVGADGEFLVADSAEATGLKYTNTLSGAFNPVTDWVTDTCSDTWSGTSVSCRWKRVGDSMTIEYLVEVTGGGQAGALGLDLPSPYEIDNTKVAQSAEFGLVAFGTGTARDIGVDAVPMRAYIRSSTAQDIDLAYHREQGTSNVDTAGVTNTAPFTPAVGDFYYVRLEELPISGWSSGLNAAIERKSIVKVRAKKDDNQTFATATNTTVIYNVEDEDNFSAYDPSTGVFTAPRASSYVVCAGIFSQATSWSANQYWQIQGSLSVSGQDDYLDREKADSASSDLYAQGCNTYRMANGETFSVLLRHIRGSNTTLTVNEDFNYLTITEVEDSIIKAAAFKKCQTKFLSADINSNTTDIADLRFSNLEVGKNYSVIVNQRSFHDNAGVDNIGLDVNDGGVKVCRTITAGNDAMAPSTSASCYFTAANTSLTTDLISLTAGNTLLGNGTNQETYITLCEESLSFTTEF